MEFAANVRVLIAVPFSLDVPEPQELEDAAAAANHAAKVEAGREDAARHAEEAIVAKLRAALGKHGEILDVLVEEVVEP